MKIQEETDVKEYQIRKKKSREQTVENMENKEKAVRETEPETTKEEDEHVKEMGMLSLDRRRNHQIELLTIIGEVEGHETVSGSTKATKYEHLLPKLAQIENSVQTLVLGGCHSIGGPLAVSADYSFIVPSGTMIIHPVRTSGMFIGVAQSLRNIEKTQDRITGFLAEHSGMSQERIEELMLDSTQLVKDVGTMLEGKRAVEEGLIDEVGGIRDALNKLHEMIDEKMENTDKNYEMT